MSTIATTDEKLSLAKRINNRLKAGMLIVIVRDNDESLALKNILPAVKQYAPVDILYPTTEGRDDKIASYSREGTGTLVLVDHLAVFGENPLAVRMIKDFAHQQDIRGDNRYGRVVLLEMPHVKIPQALMGDADIIEATLPGIEELQDELGTWVKDTGVQLEGNGEVKYALANSVTGLARHEAYKLFCRSYVEQKKLDPIYLRTEKSRRVTQRLQGALTFENVDASDVGGMDVLKEWLSSRKTSFGSAKAKDWGLPEPKGLLLLGVPGSGKSLTARCVAREWGLPLLRLDAGRLFGSLVGQSESQTRQAIEAAEACSPCVLWIDEIEKGLSSSGGGLDGGTSSRVFGAILTWLQEKTKPVFVVATANRIAQLPPELLRKGRFDEIFYVGLPTELERRDIFKIHLARRKRTLPEADIEVLAKNSDRFSGAEIEQGIIDAMFTAYSQAGREITKEDILTCVRQTTPLAKTMSEEIRAIESWAATRARPASSQQKLSSVPATGTFDNLPDLPTVGIRGPKLES